MQNPNKSNSNPLTYHDLNNVFQMPNGVGCSTLEYLAFVNDCTVEEIGQIADLANPVECVEAAMKLYIKNNQMTVTSVELLKSKSHMLDMLAYMLCGSEYASGIKNYVYTEEEVVEKKAADKKFEVAYTVDNDGMFHLDNYVLLKTCNELDIEVDELGRVHWHEIQDLSCCIDAEIVHIMFGLGLDKELPDGHKLLKVWQMCKDDMWRIDKLMKEPVK